MKYSCVRSVVLGALAACALIASEGAQAGSYHGVIKQLVVGRLQDQVLFEVAGGAHANWPCASTHPNSLNFAFDMSRPDTDALLSVLMTAYTTNASILVVGTGACTVDGTMEDVMFLWLVK